MRAQTGIVADEYDRGLGAARLREQQLQKGVAIVGIKGRGRFVSEDQRGPSNQRPCCGNPLLLADTQTRSTTKLDLLGSEPEGCEQAPRFILQSSAAFGCVTP
jgi:hypothetical protein